MNYRIVSLSSILSFQNKSISQFIQRFPSFLESVKLNHNLFGDFEGSMALIQSSMVITPAAQVSLLLGLIVQSDHCTDISSDNTLFSLFSNSLQFIHRLFRKYLLDISSIHADFDVASEKGYIDENDSQELDDLGEARSKSRTLLSDSSFLLHQVIDGLRPLLEAHAGLAMIRSMASSTENQIKSITCELMQWVNEMLLLLSDILVKSNQQSLSSTKNLSVLKQLLKTLLTLLQGGVSSKAD